MDIARSSLEIPPPAWGREAALTEGRHTVLESNAAAAWAVATCTLLGLILVVSIHLPLQARGVVALLLGLTGWSALTVRLIRALRRRDQSGLLPHVDL